MSHMYSVWATCGTLSGGHFMWVANHAYRFTLLYKLGRWLPGCLGCLVMPSAKYSLHVSIVYITTWPHAGSAHVLNRMGPTWAKSSSTLGCPHRAPHTVRKILLNRVYFVPLKLHYLANSPRSLGGVLVTEIHMHKLTHELIKSLVTSECKYCLLLNFL